MKAFFRLIVITFGALLTSCKTNSFVIYGKDFLPTEITKPCLDLFGDERRTCLGNILDQEKVSVNKKPSFYIYTNSKVLDKLHFEFLGDRFVKLQNPRLKEDNCVHNLRFLESENGSLILSNQDQDSIIVCFSKEDKFEFLIFSESLGIVEAAALIYKIEAAQ